MACVRPYEPADEQAWLRCRVLAFLDSAYFDSVEREKEPGVHPDHRRCGIGAALLDRAEELACARGLERLEAWTRDDPWVLAWYRSRGFVLVDSYLHVYVMGDGDGALCTTIDGLRPARTFAHYVGSDGDEMRRRFVRVHDCILERRLA